MYSYLILCTALNTFRILANSAFCFWVIFWHIQSHWALSRDIHTYWDISKAYLGLFSTLCNPRIFTTSRIPTPGMFRTVGLFKTQWNVDQAYSEPYHSHLSHNASDEVQHQSHPNRHLPTILRLTIFPKRLLASCSFFNNISSQ